jgi:hypothetical protein
MEVIHGPYSGRGQVAKPETEDGAQENEAQ